MAGSFENRTRFFARSGRGIRAIAPGIDIGVRFSAFDSVPFRPDPSQSAKGKLGPGIPVVARKFDSVPLGIGCRPERPQKDRFDRDHPILIFA